MFWKKGMTRNTNLNKSAAVKNDEFYTSIEDIEKEMKHYTKHFKDKVVLMPCNDSALMRNVDTLVKDEKSSKFWVFFHKNFDRLGLNKIIATHYNKDGKSYKIEYKGGNDNDVLDYVKTNLEGDGDFRSDEIVEIMKICDIVVTNPPSSKLFREFVSLMFSTNSSFILLGSPTATVYKETFSKIKLKAMWWGVNNVLNFLQPDGTQIEVRSVWYTNLIHGRINQELILYKKYNSSYRKFVNYDAIYIDKVKNIPADYNGVMGVPHSFMKYYNPDQYKIVDLGVVGSCQFTNHYKMEILKKGKPTGKYTWNAKGVLYLQYDPSIDKEPRFKNVDTGELYTAIFVRILIQKI